MEAGSELWWAVVLAVLVLLLGLLLVLATTMPLRLLLLFPRELLWLLPTAWGSNLGYLNSFVLNFIDLA